jgi:integrase
MYLSDLVQKIATERDLESATIGQYHRACRKLGSFLGKIPEVDDFSEENVNAFLTQLKDLGKSSTTIINYRVALTVIWNYAVARDLCQPFNPRKLKRPKQEQRVVRSWSLSQIKILIDACAKVPGRLQCGVATGAFLAAWVRVGYDTGLRPSDLRLLRWADVDFCQKTITLTQHKTKRAHTARLSPAALALLAEIERPPREKVFPLSKSGVRRIELILFATAFKLGFRRLRGQGLGCLRKSHATQVYTAEGESAAAESLGHISGTRTVRRHYIDSRSIKSGRLPPEPPAA